VGRPELAKPRQRANFSHILKRGSFKNTKFCTNSGIFAPCRANRQRFAGGICAKIAIQNVRKICLSEFRPTHYGGVALT